MTNSSFQDHQQFGSQLRQLREAQHLGLEEIAAQTKIPLRFIDYLERGDFAKLPLPFFTRNYITGLCRLYDTDPQPFLEYYGKVSGFNAPVEAAITPPSQSGGGLQRPGSIGLKGDVQVPANASGASAEAAKFDLATWLFFGGIIGFGLIILVTTFMDSAPASPNAKREGTTKPKTAQGTAAAIPKEETAGKPLPNEFQSVSLENFIQPVQVPVKTLSIPPSAATEAR